MQKKNHRLSRLHRRCPCLNPLNRISQKPQKCRKQTRRSLNSLISRAKGCRRNKTRDRGNLPAAAVVETKFVIQVASLKEKTKAAQMHKNINCVGYKSTVVKTEIQGKGTWFRVIVTVLKLKCMLRLQPIRYLKKLK